MSSLCASCGHVHDSSWTRAVGRFNQEPTTYRADYPGAQERTNRTEAEHDMCEQKKPVTRRYPELLARKGTTG